MRLVARIATIAILAAVSGPPLAHATTQHPGVNALSYLGARPNSRCSTLSVPAMIHGVERCLRSGRSCQQQYAQQYERYGFNCVAGHLARRPAPAKGHANPATSRPGGLGYLGAG
jgi:hypothetical protein